MDNQVQTPTIVTDVETMKAVVAVKLDKLARWRQEVQDIESVVEQQKIAVMRPIQDEIDRLMAPLKPRLDELERQKVESLAVFGPGIKKLEDEIEADALAAGGASADGKFSASGRELMVIYYGGKTSVDSKGLEGYAVAHPEVLVFIHKGKPYTSIQNTRSKKGSE
jgi:hypothetical protein